MYARLCVCIGVSKPSLLAYAISSRYSCAGSDNIRVSMRKIPFKFVPKSKTLSRPYTSYELRIAKHCFLVTVIVKTTKMQINMRITCISLCFCCLATLKILLFLRVCVDKETDVCPNWAQTHSKVIVTMIIPPLPTLARNIS